MAAFCVSIMCVSYNIRNAFHIFIYFQYPSNCTFKVAIGSLWRKKVLFCYHWHFVIIFIFVYLHIFVYMYLYTSICLHVFVWTYLYLFHVNSCQTFPETGFMYQLWRHGAVDDELDVVAESCWVIVRRQRIADEPQLQQRVAVNSSSRYSADHHRQLDHVFVDLRILVW
jgi:hypothetical protein